MLPWLTTPASESPSKRYLPALKSASLSPSVEATRPPTLTDAPLPNRMPFGLTRNTFPFAVKVPRMLDGSAPSTRLSATELLFGCKKLTASPLPILKLSQLSETFWLVCLMFMLEAPLVIVASPEVTTPSVGRA